MIPIPGVAVVGGVIIAVVDRLLGRARNARLAQLVDERRGEDIGTFARAFDRRVPEFDTKVLRAVWDELALWTAFEGGSVPLRPAIASTTLGASTKVSTT